MGKSSLKSNFEDCELCRKVELLKQLVRINLDGCDSVEDYSNKIIMTSLKVQRTGLNSDEEVTASPMLALVDSVKTLLLQEPRPANKKFFHGVLLVKPKSVCTVNAVKYCCDEVGQKLP